MASEAIINAVADENLKTIAGASAFYAAQAMGQSVGHLSRLDRISEAAVAKSIELILSTDPLEAVAASKLLTGNDTAGTLAALMATLNSGQQGVKAAQTTPPVTS